MSYQYPPNQQPYGAPPYGHPQGAPAPGPPQGYSQQPPYPQQQPYGAPPGPPPTGPPRRVTIHPSRATASLLSSRAHTTALLHLNLLPPTARHRTGTMRLPSSLHMVNPRTVSRPTDNLHLAPPPAHGAPGYGAPGPYGAPGGAPLMGPPAQPSLGYVPGQLAPGDFRQQADALRKAMKGFGTDEKALVHVLSRLDPLQMAAVRATYSKHIGRDLYKDVKSETGGDLEQGLLAVIEGPLMHDVACVREAIQGAGTKEWLLNDVLLGRSNADLNAIKAAYERTYHRQLAKDVEDDLSFKTADLFKIVLHATRHEESTPINPQAIESEVRTLHNSTAARMVNNVTEVCGIFARSSDNELRAIDQAFHGRYHASLEKHVEKEFSGHMEDALLHMLRTATDPAMRDAILLEECMAGMGTKEERLIVRVVRLHWNRSHKEQVKRAYRHRFQKDLIERVRAETSGDLERLLVALLE
ncbi:uncharacterized protein N7482_004016 [Penicillium canariense]|uniref:Annexin n=1 Tax=Penicillium canariense TaxID=189055 RepID=A0A9W9IBJ9_9EURO|nr:uncharacterized protein N7482_004016 [Penicillium canariense]KAJ5168422.1 hypothetical protein N7482_004016 [Penicillium canariense]